MRLSIAIPETQLLNAPAVLQLIRMAQASDMEADDLMGTQTILPLRRSGHEKLGTQTLNPTQHSNIAPSCLSFKIVNVQGVRHI